MTGAPSELFFFYPLLLLMMYVCLFVFPQKWIWILEFTFIPGFKDEQQKMGEQYCTLKYLIFFFTKKKVFDFSSFVVGSWRMAVMR